ncbi:MAG: hypothetical protein RMK49_20525, partial [Abditibacteriales bacterium]|nr:hypothetical protein [Abditibacteriales bacterium]
DSLSEEEQAALWDREMEKELDKDDEPELDVPPTALTPRQRRAAALSARAEKRGARRKRHR